jgi:two-component system, cell cycle sensor histidine kinase and response regulator CckA
MGTGAPPLGRHSLLDLLQSPELLSTLLARMLDGLSIIDAKGVQIYANDALCEMLGFTREELIGATAPYPYWPPEELPTIEAAFQRTLSGDVTNFELVFRRKDGARLEVIVAPAELRDESGAVLAYFATIKDISERKRLERSLLASEQRWRSIAENPFDFVVLIDRDYRYTYVNHTAPGITAESLIGRATPFDFADPENHDAMRAAFETTFETGRATSYEVHVPQLDAWYTSIVGPVVENGRVSGVSILTRDITEQRRAEEALRRSEQRLRESHRMETIGTLAGGIAHDINNILTPIMAYSDIARSELPPDHAVQEYLQGISVASERARELVQRILLFSRRQEPHKTTFDLRESVREDVTLLRASMPASIELVTELPARPVHVLADRPQIGQVLTNLATNALQAMQDVGGKLTIALEPGPAGEGYALLSVADTGPGMDAETMRRAFDPFFTTKRQGAGTGLGLSIVQSVVREHGGETRVRSAPGQGTVFTVRLPTTSGVSSPAVEAVPSSRSVTAPRMRVLVVDDEPAIVGIARQALTTAGHAVTAVTSAREALEILTRDPGAFDVILTDQSMPDVTGTSLIAEAKAILPSVICVLMTGLGDDATQRLARSLEVLEIIDKPFSVTTLLGAIERAGVARAKRG